MLPLDTSRCEGARGTSPEAALCRNCMRAEPCSETTPFVGPMARIVTDSTGSRLVCGFYVPKD